MGAIDLSVQLKNSDKVDLFLKKMPENFRFALKEAINKTAPKVQKMLKKEVPKKFEFDEKYAKVQRLQKATQEIAEAGIFLRGKGTPLIAFNTVSPKTMMTGGQGTGVRASIMGESRHFPHSFVSDLGRQSIGVYERIENKYIKVRGKKRQATRFARAESVAEMATSPKMLDETQSFTRIEFEKNFNHEVDVLLRAKGFLK